MWPFGGAERAALRGGLPCWRPWTVSDLLGPTSPWFLLGGNREVLPGRPDWGPKSLFQPGLQQRDRPGVGPRLAVEYLRERRVVDPAQAGYLADAAVAGDGEGGVDEEPDGFDSRVGGGRVRPAGQSGSRGGSSGGGHGTNVRARMDGLRFRYGNPVFLDTTPPSSVCSNRQVEGVPDGWQPITLGKEARVPSRSSSPNRTVPEHVVTAVADYTPAMAHDRWEPVAAFVRETVVDYMPHTTVEGPHDYLAAISPFVAWAHLDAGYDLTREALFDAELICYYVAAVMPGGYSTRQTRRNQLLRVADYLLPERRRVIRMAPIPKGPASPPYPRGSLNKAVAWPMEQTTTFRKHAAACIVHFGLGAGLRSAELAQLRREDVVEDHEGVLVHVRGGRNPRVVPVRVEHEDQVVVLADCVAPGSFVFRPDRSMSSVNAVSAWLSRLTPFMGQTINPGRLRATWLVAHLNGGIPAAALVYAAGVATFTAFDRYLPYVDPERHDELIAMVRRADREKLSARRARYMPYVAATEAARRERARQRDEFRRSVT